MANNYTPLDLAIDTRTLEYLQGLAAELATRMESIVAKYPAGTFDEREPEPDHRGIPDEPAPKRRTFTRKAAKKGNKPGNSIGLTDAIRKWAADHSGVFILPSFANATNGKFKRTSMSGVISGMAKTGEFTRDPDTPGTYYLAR